LGHVAKKSVMDSFQTPAIKVGHYSATAQMVPSPRVKKEVRNVKVYDDEAKIKLAHHITTH
jgi:hypothetical protein